MAQKEHDQLLDHEYDGIREYDNPTPAWWHLIFLGTVGFGIVYYLFFQIGNAGWTVQEAHQTAVAEDLKRRFQEIGELQGDEATILEYMQQPDWLAVGTTVFATHCKSCHGSNGEGSVGPNLTDDHYKNVKELADLVKVLENGAAAGAMPAWRTRLHPNEIVLSAAYVATLRGKNLPSPRSAEGEIIPPWPESPTESLTESPAGTPENAGDGDS
jgi:cytochrome c oxidase cbb3-type subunit 3